MAACDQQMHGEKTVAFSEPNFLCLDHRLGDPIDSVNERLLAQISVPKLRADSGRKCSNPISPQEAQDAQKSEIGFVLRENAKNAGVRKIGSEI